MIFRVGACLGCPKNDDGCRCEHACRKDSRHSATLRRVIPCGGGSVRSGEADQSRQGALPGDRHHQGRGLRLLRRIAEVMVPHIAGRPATRKRWPNGVDEPAFFEKQLASRHRTGWTAAASPTGRARPLSGHRHASGAGLDRPAGGAGSACAAMAVRRSPQARARHPPGVRPRPR